MATLGKIQEFKSEDETIEAYLERMQLFIDANSIKDDKRVVVLLSVIRSKMYGILRNVLAPEKPNEKTYDQLTAALKAHFNPKPVVIAERFHFHHRTQSGEESVTEYVAELKKLARNCNFSQHLEEALWD
jgi:RNase H-fold protein (predicted Holliday junction resolvase)